MEVSKISSSERPFDRISLSSSLNCFDGVAAAVEDPFDGDPLDGGASSDASADDERADGEAGENDWDIGDALG
jgi:hypothetical protein